MNKIQIRYFQIILVFSLGISQFISSVPLAYSSLFGLVGIWYYESVISQEVHESINQSFMIFFGFLLYSLAILFFNRSTYISNYVYILVLFLILIFFLSLTDVSTPLMGNFLLYYLISFSIVSFIFSDTFYVHRNIIIYSFLLTFLLQTIATFLGIQYSNYQYYFRFFLVLISVMGASLILSNPILYSFIASIGVSLFTVLFYDLFIKLRISSNKEIDNQIYVHDYLISLLGAFYLTNFTSTYIGLF